MAVIIWLIVGVIAALGANRNPDVTDTKDKVLNFVFGIVGALLGGFTTNLVMRLPVFGFSWASLFVAALGAFVFLVILALVRR